MYIPEQKEVNEKFGRKMNHDVDAILEGGKVNGGKWRVATE